jgi:hypothetical protein
MKLKDGFILRQVGGHSLVVPVGSKVVDFNCMITLNDAGAFLWQQLQEERTAEQLTAALLEEYDVTAEVAAADVAAFVEKLQQAELLV